MKARALKKRLNNTGYSVHFRGGKICVGSPLCQDLFSVDMDKKEVRYALDTFRQGRDYLQGKGEGELLFIFDTLTELINTGEINQYIEGKDDLENPITVYSVEDGKVVKHLAEKCGYPHITDNGILMYDNNFFTSEEDAVRAGIEEYECGVKSFIRIVADKQAKLEDARKGLGEYQDNLKALSLRLADIEKTGASNDS